MNDEVYCHTVSDSAQQSPAVADAYERGVSINSLSKGFGLPGLRVGWVACRDRSVLERVAVAKAALSSCFAVPTEMLAQVALREAPHLIARARSMGLANRQHLDLLLHRYPGSFEATPSHNLAFAFPRYRCIEGAEVVAIRLVLEAGTLLLPANLWQSPLGEVPRDRLRISLGQAGVAAGLAAIDTHLNSSEGRRHLR